MRGVRHIDAAAGTFDFDISQKRGSASLAKRLGGHVAAPGRRRCGRGGMTVASRAGALYGRPPWVRYM